MPTSSRPTTAASLPRGTLLATALAFGLAADLLVRGSHGPGLNLFLLFVLLAGAIVIATRAARLPLGVEAWACLAAALLFASGVVLRGSESLQAYAALSAAALLAFPALRAGGGWLRTSGVGDLIEAIVGAVAYAGLGTFRLLFDGRGRESGDRLPAPGRALPVLRGLVLAIPFLLVFGALLVSADRVAHSLLTELVGDHLQTWASRLLVTGLLGWLLAGYLTGFLSGTGLRGAIPGRLSPPALGIVEVGIVLGLLNLLFLAFMGVQFRYLFGGADVVGVTPGLTYAEYAREGFGQLVLASALVLPTLLAADVSLRVRRSRDRRVFQGLAGLQLLLLLGILLSAFQRVAAYRDAFGLTESRFYGTAFLVWLGVVALAFAVTVLVGRRERFAFPALVSGLALVAVLFALNPDVRIARTNLVRAGVPAAALAPDSTEAPAFPDGAAVPSTIDVAYLGWLGADAVPTLLRALPHLPPMDACPLAGRLLERWGDDRADWRSWNAAVARARAQVRDQARGLRGYSEPTGGCPPA